MTRQEAEQLIGQERNYHIDDWTCKVDITGTIVRLYDTDDIAEISYGEGRFVKYTALQHITLIKDMPAGKSTVETVSTSDPKEYKEKVDVLVNDGYKIMSTACGYAGEVGGSVYDCDWYMAVLVWPEACMK